MTAAQAAASAVAMREFGAGAARGRGAAVVQRVELAELDAYLASSVREPVGCGDVRGVSFGA